MKELLEVLAKSLVDEPDQVVVTETENGKTIVKRGAGRYGQSNR